jgi:hypothetical protein
MYCPSCGNEIAVELKYCNRCGANLSLPTQPQVVTVAPIRLAVPSIVVGLTSVIGLGIIIGGASQMAIVGVPPVAVVWMALFAVATLFGCTGLLIRFLTKLVTLQREVIASQTQPIPSVVAKPHAQQLPPRYEPVPSVTENTTRTFSPVYTEPPDRGPREY